MLLLIAQALGLIWMFTVAVVLGILLIDALADRLRKRRIRWQRERDFKAWQRELDMVRHPAHDYMPEKRK